CAALPPLELADAQRSYRQAAAGPARTLAPDQLQKARAALDQAELAFGSDGDVPSTRDLAYIAERKAIVAGVKGRSELADQERWWAAARRDDAQARLQAKSAQLRSTQKQLAEKDLAAARDQRGLVLTLSGDLLFLSGQAVLLPSAQQRL